MNLKLAESISSFLIKAQALFEALQKDNTVKSNLFPDSNIVEQILGNGFTCYGQARLADMEYLNFTQDSTGTKAIFEARHEEAVAIFRKHTVLLQVALKYNPQKLLDLGIIGREEEKTTVQWIANSLHSYQLLLSDQETMTLMGKLNLEQRDFEKGKTAITEFNNAYMAMTVDRPLVKLAIEKRDKTVRELVDQVSFIQALLLQAYGNDPKQLKKYNMPLVNDEIGREMSISMVKDSSIT